MSHGSGFCAAAGGIQPTRPGDVGFDVGIFFEKRNEARPGVAAGALGLVVVPIIVPGDFDIARNAAHQPVGDIEGKSVLHGGAGDAGGIEVVEQATCRHSQREVSRCVVEGVEETFDARDERWRVRKGAQEEQAFVEADEVVRIPELEL